MRRVKNDNFPTILLSYVREKIKTKLCLALYVHIHAINKRMYDIKVVYSTFFFSTI